MSVQLRTTPGDFVDGKIFRLLQKQGNLVIATGLRSDSSAEPGIRGTDRSADRNLRKKRRRYKRFTPRPSQCVLCRLPSQKSSATSLAQTKSEPRLPVQQTQWNAQAVIAATIAHPLAEERRTVRTHFRQLFRQRLRNQSHSFTIIGASRKLRPRRPLR